eukprot:Skav214473  [mRNA]  locus=scaffold1167:167958:170161:+ [translate_table: standard]
MLAQDRAMIEQLQSRPRDAAAKSAVRKKPPTPPKAPTARWHCWDWGWHLPADSWYSSGDAALATPASPEPVVDPPELAEQAPEAPSVAGKRLAVRCEPWRRFGSLRFR